ncbi:MAG TPA: T9SS type A sorting domain-containing protein [Chryseosolibacter sp.]|nr:T9SS type A sorting domain-containing protein [Chryseosolibacter sp.]
MRKLLLLLLPVWSCWTPAFPQSPAITTIEYFVNTDPGFGNGTPVSFNPLDLENVTFTVPTASLSGVNKLYVRTKDSNGVWSFVASRIFYINASAAGVSPNGNIDYVEVFFDVDPGKGNGTSLPLTESAQVDITETLDVSSLSPGIHTMYVRSRNTAGVYSMPVRKLVFINPSPPPSSSVTPITYVEYFFDTDPGKGNGTALPVTSSNDVSIIETLDVSSLTPGVHKLFVRGRNEDGLYSMLVHRLVYVNPTPVAEPELTPIAYVEYFFDNDPGRGNATALPLTADFDLTFSESFDIESLNPGVHKLHVRARDEAGHWSILGQKLFIVNKPVEPVLPAPEVTRLEYYVNKSPAIGTAKQIAVTHSADVTINETLDLTQLRNGNHKFIFRAKNNHGFWSYPDTIEFTVSGSLITSVTPADSLALVALFNATGGENWTVNTNWLSGNVETWNGVTVENDSIKSIVLESNNLTGEVPDEVIQLADLEIVSLRDNQLTSIPNFSLLPAISSLDVSENSLDFTSLEPNAGVVGIQYNDQAGVGTVRNTKVYAGATFNTSVSMGGTQNQYQWFHDGITIEGANEATLTVDETNRSSKGAYVCEITNDLLPGLTLTAEPDNLTIIADIGGKLYASASDPANSGQIILLKVTDTGGYDTLMNQEINTDGSYALAEVPLDNYQLLGFPDPQAHPDALPTYYKNTIYWEEADVLELEGSTDTLNIIAQQRPEEPVTGSGVIDGYVVEDDGTTEGGRVKAKRRVGKAGASVRRVEGSGRGQEELTLVAYVLTDDNGEFAFAELPEGIYRLNIQYPGYLMDPNSFIDITIGAALESQKRVEAAVEEGKIVVRNLVITGVWGEDYQVDVFPNPASEIITLAFGREVQSRTLTIYDTRGTTIKQIDVSMPQYAIDVSSFAKGIYLLDVREGATRMKTLRLEIK